MSRISNAHTVSIVAAPTTVLGQIIAAMPSRSWVQLDGVTRTIGSTPNVACTVPQNIGDNLRQWRDDPVQATNTSFSVYGNKALWNPIDNSIEMVGRYHDVFNQFLYARYLENTHEVVVSRYGKYNSITAPTLQYGTHNNDQHTLNPYTGVNYFKTKQSGYKCIYWPSGGSYGAAEGPGDPTLAPNAIQIPDENANAVCNGIDWWHGSITGSQGQGLLCVISSNNDFTFHIQFWEPISAQWLTRTTSTIPNQVGLSTYNGQIVYSRTKNVAIVTPGHRANNRLWRLNPDRTLVEYASNPAPVLVHLTGAHIVADPVTGNFLVHGNYNGSFWEFNPDGDGTWTNLNTGGTIYNAGVTQIPTDVNWNTSSNGNPGVLVASLWEHGACAYISSSGGTNNRMHIYKHG